MSVAKSVFKELYESAGWVPCEDPQLVTKTNMGKTFMHSQPDVSYSHTARRDRYRNSYESPTVEEDFEEDDFDNMSYQDLLAYAKDHGIQLGKIRKQEDIIDLLRGEM